MTVKLRRLWLDSIGDPSARFADVLIDFTDADQSPLDTIVWLRNGGGKTSLLALTFSLILPRQDDFLGGKEQQRSLADYVQSGDTSHVIAEWETEHGPVITGAVYEWPDRRRPTDHTRHRSELIRRWYIGHPSDGFDIGTMPVRGPDGRLRIDQFMSSLRSMSRQRHGAVLVATSQQDWRQALESFGIDQAVFKYQKSMNRGEGSIDELFRFPTPEQFIDFLIDLVVDDDEPNSFAARLRAVTSKVASRPKLQLEREFCDGAADRLGPVAATWLSYSASLDRMQGLSSRAWTLQGQLGAAAETARIDHNGVEAQLEQALGKRRELNRRYRAELQRLEDARSIHAQLREREARELVERLQEEIVGVEREQQRWDALEELLTLADIDDQIRQVDALLAARTAGAEPLRVARNTAASALLSRYSARLSALNAQSAEAETQHKESSALVESARREAAGWRDERDIARLAAQRADDAIAQIEQALEHAVERGEIPADSDPNSAVASARATEASLLSEDARLKERIDDLGAALRALRDEREPLTNKVAEQRQLERAHTERADAISDEANRFAAYDRVRAMAQTDDVAIWAAGEAVARRLADEIAEANSSLVELGVERHRDLRNRESLGEGGLLPPSRDVDAILAVLADAGIPATSGLSFLSASVKRSLWDATIATHPGLLSGIVVDASDFERAREAAIDAGLHPASLVTVGPKEDVLNINTDGAVGFVVPPSPALFDRQAAELERSRLDRVLEEQVTRTDELASRVESDSQLKASLADFLQRQPAGILDVERHAAATAQAAATAAESRLDAIAAEIDKLEVTRDEGLARREEIADERRALGSRLERLTRLAEQVSRLPQLQQDASSAHEARNAAASEAAEAERRAGGAELARDEAADRRRELRSTQEKLNDRVSEVTYVGEGVDTTDDRSITTDALEEAFRLADGSYREEVNDLVLTGRRDDLVANRAKVSARLPSSDAALLSEARELIGDPDAASAELRKARRNQIRDSEMELSRQQTLAKSELDAAEHALRDSPGRNGALTLDIAPNTRAAAAELVSELEALTTRIRSDELEVEHNIGELRDRLKGLDSRATTMALLAANLENLVGRPADEASHPPFDGDDELARAVVEELQGELRTAIDGRKVSRDALDAAGVALRAFSTRAEYVTLSGVADGAVVGEVELLGPKAEQLAKHLRDRVVVLDAELASIDKDRNILVTDLLGQVRSVLDLLARAGRTLVMPDGLEGWAGLSFLAVRFDRSDDESEMRRLLGSEIDRIVAAGNVPEGMSCLKRSVHAVVPKGFKVTVLKPSAELATQRHPITRMGGWSGGEKLTAAVLLYCTLARLRASRRRQTLTDVGAGVLVLDNPLGKASYVGFVALQRRVAAELGVQLVYTTAVRDLGAVGKFPNVVRCRNVTPPGRNRSFVGVELRQGAAHGIDIDAGVVSTARVLRTDPPAATAETELTA